MKVAFVSGASGGIGKAVAEKFILEGYFVVGQYNTGESKISALIAELKNKGLSEYFMPVKCDFCDIDSVESALKKTGENFKHINVLVNNAGIDLYKTLTDTTVKEWQKVFDVNVRSAYLLSNYALKSMIDLKCGSIVNVSSVWGAVGGSMEVAYSASKSALIGFTKALAKEVAPSGIRVNCVCPGVINTPMNDCFSEEEIRDIIDRTPLKRIGRPEEIAELIYFLSEEKSAFITGQIITADGGFTL